MHSHLTTKPFINRSIENYKGHRILCGKDNAIGSYATFVFGDFGDRPGNEDANTDNIKLALAEHVNSDDDDNGNFLPPVASNIVNF